MIRPLPIANALTAGGVSIAVAIAKEGPDGSALHPLAGIRERIARPATTTTLDATHLEALKAGR